MPKTAKVKAPPKSAKVVKSAAAAIKPPPTITIRAEMIAVDRFRPNPYQPPARLELDEETAARVGQSLIDHGQINPVVCREVDGFFEMGYGWQRRFGAIWATEHGHPELAVLRAEVRELTDEQMDDMVYEANEIRKDLTDIDKAWHYKKSMEDFGLSQTEFAKRHNISQSEVANTIRLLELSEPIKAKVISREISGTHARQLLRLNALPELQDTMVEQTLKNNLSVAQLDDQINRTLYNQSKGFNDFPKPLFDLAECLKCEFSVMVADPWGNRKKEPRCTKVECWLAKQAVAEKEAAKAADSKLTKKLAKGTDIVLTEKDAPYDKRETLVSGIQPTNRNYHQELEDPEQCDKCPKRALYRYTASSGAKPDEICLDKACYRKKKSARTRSDNKTFKEKDKALTLRLGDIALKTCKNRYGALVLSARFALHGLPTPVKDDLLYMFPNVPKLAKGQLDVDKLRTDLVGMAEPELIKLLVAINLSRSRREFVENNTNGYSVRLGQKQRFDVAIMEDTIGITANEITTWQKANCTGCDHANSSLIDSPEECCKFSYYKKMNEAGQCENSPVIKPEHRAPEIPAEPKPADFVCTDCGCTAAAPCEDDSDHTCAVFAHGLCTFCAEDMSPEERAEYIQNLAEPESTGTPIPEGVRLCEHVPNTECHDCALQTEDHTIGMKFETSPGSFSKVCIKDLRRSEKTSATQPAEG